MIKTKKAALPLFVVIAIAYYWKVFIHNLIPFPGDLMVGAYFPWLEYRWGYDVGVPVKNALISDIFSQFFIWKSLIAESYRSGMWPLWNPYSYSGYPLLANFNSGALNPFNFLMVLLGDVKGWSMMIVAQTLGSMISMFLFLRSRKISLEGAVIGGVVFAFSGFAITWSQFQNVGYAFIWIALSFLFIEKYFAEKKLINLLLLSPLVFLLIISGHFQAVVYSLIFFSTYFIWKLRTSFSLKPLLICATSISLGVSLASIQLFPTLELMGLSVRFLEGYIAEYNFGLLPVANIITFFAPDYFGNPSTGNYWGVFNYHETIIYLGILSIFAFVAAVYNFKKLGDLKFFVAATVVAMLLLFDTFFGRLIFIHQVPLISTSAAGRISMIIAFSGSVLSAWFFDFARRARLVSIIRIFWWLPVVYVATFAITYFFHDYYQHYPTLELWEERTWIGVRNLIYPTAIFALLLFSILLLRKTKLLFWAILCIVLFDLFRFGWKFTPFVSAEYVYPKTEITNYLVNQEGYFRVDREHGQVLPPNTWTMYGLMSPSGYDPMAVEKYVSYHNMFLNKTDKGYPSRYSEISQYDPIALGEMNVKYLLALRRDDKGVIESNGDSISYRIDKKDWNEAYSTTGTTILENPNYKPRVEVEGGVAEIATYELNRVQISFDTEKSNAELMLRDAWYPGWKAFQNGKEVEVYENSPFRAVMLTDKEGLLEFVYSPDSFKLGMIVSGVSLLLWLTVVIVILKSKD